MIKCEVYELLSYLTNLERNEDIIVSAQKVNKLEAKLRTHGIRCDFSRRSLEVAAQEYPERFVVHEQFIRIKAQPKEKHKFVYFNSNKAILSKIELIWEKDIKEF